MSYICYGQLLSTKHAICPALPTLKKKKQKRGFSDFKFVDSSLLWGSGKEYPSDCHGFSPKLFMSEGNSFEIQSKMVKSGLFLDVIIKCRYLR